MTAKLGVIGGSGVYQMEKAKLVDEHKIETPFGLPSDVIVEATIDAQPVFFLPRHGKNHSLLPSEVNYRANIYALKSLDVTHVIGINACGIMREDISPGDMVIPDQIFDRTNGTRPSTFFGDGVVGHVTFADPFCQELGSLLAKSAQKLAPNVHTQGTYLCIEGPQFSSRAESHFFRKTMAPAVIGMTGVPEAKLAREAELCYAMLALATDYDCWHETEDDVSVDTVLRVLKANASVANSIIANVVTNMPEQGQHCYSEAAKTALLTPVEAITPERKKELAVLYGKYFG